MQDCMARVPIAKRKLMNAKSLTVAVTDNISGNVLIRHYIQRPFTRSRTSELYRCTTVFSTNLQVRTNRAYNTNDIVILRART